MNRENVDSPGNSDNLLRRVVGFSLVPFFSLLAPFVALPVLAGASGPGEWAGIAMGQSMGGVTALVVGLGWPLTGPIELAAGSRLDASMTYYDSLVSRILLTSVALPALVVIVGFAAPPGVEVLACAMAISTAIIALNWNWVAIGLGRPRLLLILDVVPRMAFIGLSIWLITGGGSLLWYPFCLLVSTIFSLALSFKWVVRPRRGGRRLQSVVSRSFARQWAAAVTTVSAGAYSVATLFVVGLATTVQDTAVTASADRLYRVGTFAIIALSSALQSWVIHRNPVVAANRRLVALRLHAGLAVVGGCVMALGAPMASALLFGSALSPSWNVTVWYGLAFGAVALSTSVTMHFLLPEGRKAVVLACTSVGAAVGTPCIYFSARSFGSLGAAAAFGLIEAFVLVLLSTAVLTRNPGLRGHLATGSK